MRFLPGGRGWSEDVWGLPHLIHFWIHSVCHFSKVLYGSLSFCLAFAAEGPMKIHWVEVMLVVASPSGSLVLWLPNIDLAGLLQNAGIEWMFKRHTFKKTWRIMTRNSFILLSHTFAPMEFLACWKVFLQATPVAINRQDKMQSFTRAADWSVRVATAVLAIKTSPGSRKDQQLQCAMLLNWSKLNNLPHLRLEEKDWVTIYLSIYLSNLI